MFDRLMKQPMMTRLLYSLIPIIIFSIYLFGWQVLTVILFCNITGFLSEYLFIRKKKNGKVTMAVFVTSTLLGLTLPPTIPLWIAGVGTAFAVIFGKMVFGGFGMNVFNPAIVGRAFVYVSFPQQMTITWLKPFTIKDFPGGFIRYFSSNGLQTSATILNSSRHSEKLVYSFQDAFTGFIPGCIGETSAILIILAALFLILTKTAKWQPMLSTLFSILLFNILFYPHYNPFYFLVSGGVMFGIVFMTTDPVSQPKGKYSIWIYGMLIGFLTVFIRKYSLFAEGFMFALLLTNAFMPIIEYALDRMILSSPVKKAG